MASAGDAHARRPGRKTFVPLENNPEVMTPLAHRLGLTPRLAFHDVLSLDDPALLAPVPRPVAALLFLFPCTPVSESHMAAEDTRLPLYDGRGPDEPAVWFRQTIGHACGLIGCLHCVANVRSEGAVRPESMLASMLADVVPLGPAERAQYLYDSEALESVHAEAARQGATVAPSPDEDPGCGYVAFVKGGDGCLWELEGRRKGPLNRGPMGEGEDLLGESVLERGPRAWVRREIERGGDARFSCLALAPLA